MKFNVAIDQYIADQQLAGRINSPKTVLAYRGVLERHAIDVQNRDPRLTGRDDVKRTLARWPNPNTQRCSRSILVAFYDWAGEEGIRTTNPARLTRRPKKRPTQVYRLTRHEVAAMLEACETTFERRAIYLGICAGTRSAELRGLQGAHFDRDGWIWVSADIAKGGKERWVPVTIDLEPVVNDIRATVAPAHFVLPGSYVGGGAHGSAKIERTYLDRGCSSQTLQRTVHRVAARAGIAAHVHPHLLRHAFATYAARHAGVLVGRAVLGHADIRTTQAYLDTPGLDEIAANMAGIAFRDHDMRHNVSPTVRRGRDSNPRSTPAHQQVGGTPTNREEP